jgi:hypothetical protein
MRCWPLASSMPQGVVPILPKVPGVPIALRLQSPGLVPIAVDTHFSLLRDLLDVSATRQYMRMENAPTPSCLRCRPPASPETVLYFFTSCERMLGRNGISLFQGHTHPGVSAVGRVPSHAGMATILGQG